MIEFKKVLLYLQEVFGEEFIFHKLTKNETKTIPFYVMNEYNVFKGNFLGKEIVLAEKIGEGHFTPLQYKKHAGLLNDKFGMDAVLVLPDIKGFNRKRLINNQINFIIADKQIFIPNLLIDLKEYKLKNKKVDFLQPAAQCMVLFHLQKQSLNKLNYKQISALLQYPYLTISRAVDNLRKLNICKIEGTKGKQIIFDLNKKELWHKALPYMKTPIKKTVFINEQLPVNMTSITNTNALAFYTDINDDTKRHYAINNKDFIKLVKEKQVKTISGYDGDYIVELWRYNPNVLSDNKFVDPLSLYLTYKDTKDERIEMALEQIIKKQQW